jgi:hypothetical protein
MASVAVNESTMRVLPHPNDFDRRRIERALKARKRYRYVSPSVAAVAGGYRIESPCCSRNIDADGGVDEVALLLFDESREAWQLFRMDHNKRAWQFHSSHGRLIELLAELNADPEREFWQ